MLIHSRHLNIARSIALNAGQHIIDNRPTEVRKKGDKDLVSNLDEHAEHMICSNLREQFPNIPIYAEEEGGAKDANTRWIIDPIDGTTNFVQGIPHFAVSIALQWEGEVVVGVTYDPSKNELFSAIKEGGAFLNDQPIYCSPSCDIGDAVLATGFPYDRHQRADELLTYVRAFMMRARGIRRFGAATLDMAYVACGRMDGFWEFGLQPWDVAAGTLLIAEAGGVCSQIDGGPINIDAPQVLTANSNPLWDEMLRIIQSVES